MWVPKNPAEFPPNLRVGFWQNGFFRGFLFLGRRIFFCSRILSPNFFSSFLWEKVPRKILQENPRQNGAKTIQNLYNKNPRHMSAEGPGQQIACQIPLQRIKKNSPTSFCRRAGRVILKRIVTRDRPKGMPQKLGNHPNNKKKGSLSASQRKTKSEDCSRASTRKICPKRGPRKSHEKVTKKARTLFF